MVEIGQHYMRVNTEEKEEKCIGERSDPSSVLEIKKNQTKNRVLKSRKHFFSPLRTPYGAYIPRIVVM